jgi:feruloyl esterase
MWKIVHKEALRQCDSLDGYADGIIEDPEICHFDVEPLVCRGTTDPRARSASCLTESQASFVRQVYKPLLNTDGSVIWPGTSPGVEPSVLSGYGAPHSIATDWFRAVIFENLTWDPVTLTLADISKAAGMNPAGVDTWNGNLSRFKDVGGKIIHYHGSMDSIIDYTVSPNYYKHVLETMQATPKQLDEFYRFFRISGMDHCFGGRGAWDFGQLGLTRMSSNPDENVYLSIVRWVEEGIAPEKIIGTGWDTKTNKVALKRAHCKYPARNRYKGSGDPMSVGSWECVSRHGY